MPKGFTVRATNIRVIDGDSIECDFKRQRVRVRLYGIDAPELGQPGPQSVEVLDLVKSSPR